MNTFIPQTFNYAPKIGGFNFFQLIVQYPDCCQRSMAVGKAVAELRIERIWL